MEILGAALRHDANLSTGGPTIFCIVVRRQDLYLLRGIRVGDADAGSVGASTNGHGPVLRDQCILVTTAVDIDIVIQAETEATQRLAVSAHHARFKHR